MGFKDKLPQSKPDGFDSSLGEGASGAPSNFVLEPETLPLCQGPISEGAVERMRDWGSFLEGEGTDYVLRPLFSKSSDDFFPHFFSKAALTADFGQNSPGFGQSA